MRKLDNVYIVGTGSFLPGEPVSNEEIGDYIKPMNAQSDKIKRIILKQNGIKTRYYAIDKEGKTVHSIRHMAAEAGKSALEMSPYELSEITLLTAGTVGGDQIVPGFANMLQGYMKAPPLETSSHSGICMSGMIALKHAALAVECGENPNALVCAAELPSRMFKKSRFQGCDYNTDFDSHFLRWMLSDGAGSMVLDHKPKQDGLSLKVNFIHTKSFSGDFPTCMQIGSPHEDDSKSFLDYDSMAEAEKAGSFFLRQDVRLIQQLFDVGVHEYIKLANDGFVNVDEIDHFLCHYSSQKFAPVVKEVFEKANLSIPDEKWYSNLSWRGNTGSASIFIMLDDFIKEFGKNFKGGEKIFCLIPESARISISYMLLEVVKTDGDSGSEVIELPEAPSESLDTDSDTVAKVLRDLTEVWHDYRSRAWRSKFIQKIQARLLTEQDYVNWAGQWVPQVREGAKWMRKAISNVGEPYMELKDTIETHASEEQNDWKVLFEDYRNAGGEIEDPDKLSRNIGGEALNGFMYHRAAQANAVDLLGGIYIIEGTGQKIIPNILPYMRKQTGLGPECFNFLKYHSENDPHHLARWLGAVEYVLSQAQNPKEVGESIVKTAQVVANLYLMQWENL